MLPASHKNIYIQEIISILIKLCLIKLLYGSINVTEFAKRGLIHASNFPTLTSHNFIFKQAIKLKFSVLLVH